MVRDTDTGGEVRPLPGPPHAESLIPLDAAAERLSISRRMVEKLVASGELLSLKIGDRRLIHPRDLQAFVDARRPFEGGDA